MAKTIDMQDIMHLNLFEKVTRIRTRFCFKYNGIIFFCVQKMFMSRAIGERGNNVRRLSQILNKKIKVIRYPESVSEAREFIEAIVVPVTFKGLEVNENEIILSGNTQTKATIIGRNKRRLVEMQSIIKDFFRRDFRVS